MANIRAGWYEEFDHVMSDIAKEFISDYECRKCDEIIGGGEKVYWHYDGANHFYHEACWNKMDKVEQEKIEEVATGC